MIDQARLQTGRARIGHLNRAINLAIRPMGHFNNYGVSEKWKAPLATLATGAGNCTDYAIAKYFALGEVGIPSSDRRLVVVRVKSLGQERAVVAVREEQHWLILDSRSLAIVDAADTAQYVPLFVFDDREVRQVVKSAPHAARAVCPRSS